MPKAKTWEEYKAECEAVAKPGITILGWVGEWKGNSTKLKCRCDKHGEWSTTPIYRFKKGVGCFKCALERITTPDEQCVESFMRTGSFKEGTTFVRNKQKRHYGAYPYWDYTCPVCSQDEYVKTGVCSGLFTSQTHKLKRGGTIMPLL